MAVPLGPREATGIVWALRPGRGDNLKSLKSRHDYPALKAPLRAFIDWVANWTLAPKGLVLRMTIRVLDHAAPEKVKLGVRLIGPPPKRMTPARQKVLALLQSGEVLAKADLVKQSGCSSAVIDGLLDEGTLEALPFEALPWARPVASFAAPKLEGAQQAAANHLNAQVETHDLA